MENKIILGKVIGRFGTKGQVKVLLYHNKPSWLEKQSLIGNDNFTVDIYPYKSRANLCVGTVQREVSLGEELWMYRESLPEDKIYLCDLLGVNIIHKSIVIGSLVTVHEIANQDIFECSNGEYFNEKHTEQVGLQGIFLFDNARP